MKPVANLTLDILSGPDPAQCQKCTLPVTDKAGVLVVLDQNFWMFCSLACADELDWPPAIRGKIL